jgi:5-methylcytosine-specific restriction endonuclease McrA
MVCMKPDKLKKKARSIAANHYKGRGKTEKVLQLLIKALNEKCPYCGEPLTLLNISLDHAVPLTRSKLPDSKQVQQGKTEPYTTKELALLTGDDNKLFCCSRCNKAKGDLDDIEFKMLVNYLTKWEKVVKSYLGEDKIYKLSPKKGSVKEVLTRMKSGGLRYAN